MACAPSGGQGGTQTGSQTGSQSDAIGTEAARDIALNHAGVALAQTSKMEVEPEFDEDIPCYKVEFKSGGYEYEYEIGAFDGAILKTERDRDD